MLVRRDGPRALDANAVSRPVGEERGRGTSGVPKPVRRARGARGVQRPDPVSWPRQIPPAVFASQDRGTSIRPRAASGSPYHRRYVSSTTRSAAPALPSIQQATSSR
ncbi:hypothetical protein ACFQ51_05360 [Streptomyces kaempferi]